VSAPVTLQVKVKPNARTSVLVPPEAGEAQWSAQLKAPPVDGKANAELVALVAAHFGCRKADVTIRSGASGRIKRVQVDLG
jgi:uncharacterized protein